MITTSTRRTRPALNAYAGPPSPHPIAAGLCRYCRRPMWTHVKDGEPLLKATADESTCVSCVAWIADHPGQDPRHRRGTAAERIPAERAEVDDSWRRSGLEACAEAPSALMLPDPEPDEPGGEDLDTEALLAARRGIARSLCGGCGVREACLRAAHDNGFEGLWGGVWFTYRRWSDLSTGDYGPTANVTGSRRRDMLARSHAARQARLDREAALAEVRQFPPVQTRLRQDPAA